MKTISIKHGEFKNLDMPPMTMFFQVKDASMLDKVKAKQDNCWMWVNKTTTLAQVSATLARK